MNGYLIHSGINRHWTNIKMMVKISRVLDFSLRWILNCGIHDNHKH